MHKYAMPWTPVFVALGAVLLFAPFARAQGFLYVSDGDNNRILQFDTSGNLIQTLSSPLLWNPDGLAFDTAGNLYVANPNFNTISKVDSSETFSTFAQTFKPVDLATDGTNLYVDHANGVSQVISKVNSAGNVTTFATLPFVYDSGGLAYDTSNSLLWVGDDIGNMIKLTPDGTATYYALSSTDSPDGVTIDSNHNAAFVSDYTNLQHDLVYRYGSVTPTGNITEFTLPFAPGGMTIDPDGNLYTTFIDGTLHFARISPTNIITTFDTGVVASANAVLYSTVSIPEPSSLFAAITVSTVLLSRRRNYTGLT
jgi:sugar lactone lactonase YvrE